LEATITIEYDDEKLAKGVSSAVSPDNYKTPLGLTVTTKRKDRKVTTEIKSEDKMATFIATIDDLLFCVSLAEKTLFAVRKVQREVIAKEEENTLHNTSSSIENLED